MSIKILSFSAIVFAQLNTDNLFTLKAVNKFNFFLLKGIELRKDSSLIEYRFVEESNRYIFKLKFVPKAIGIFALIFSNAANVVQESDNCKKSFFNINVSNPNRNPHLSPSYMGGPYPEGGDYYFKVVP